MEVKQKVIFWKQAYLAEHSLCTTTYGHSMLAESEYHALE